MFEKIAALRAQWRYAFVALGLLGALASVSVTNAVDAVPPDGGRGQPVTPLATPNSEHGSNNCEPSPEQQRRMDGAREYVKKNGIEGFDLKWDCVSNGPVLVTKEIPEDEKEPLIVAYFDSKGNLHSFWIERGEIFHGAPGENSWLVTHSSDPTLMQTPGGKSLSELIEANNRVIKRNEIIIFPQTIDGVSLARENFEKIKRKWVSNIQIEQGAGFDKRYAIENLAKAIELIEGLNNEEYGNLKATFLAAGANINGVEFLNDYSRSNFVVGNVLNISRLSKTDFDPVKIAGTAIHEMLHQLQIGEDFLPPMIAHRKGALVNGAGVLDTDDRQNAIYQALRRYISNQRIRLPLDKVDLELLAYLTGWQALRALEANVRSQEGKNLLEQSKAAILKTLLTGDALEGGGK